MTPHDLKFYNRPDRDQQVGWPHHLHRDVLDVLRSGHSPAEALFYLGTSTMAGLANRFMRVPPTYERIDLEECLIYYYGTLLPQQGQLS